MDNQRYSIVVNIQSVPIIHGMDWILQQTTIDRSCGKIAYTSLYYFTTG